MDCSCEQFMPVEQNWIGILVLSWWQRQQVMGQERSWSNRLCFDEVEKNDELWVTKFLAHLHLQEPDEGEEGAEGDAERDEEAEGRRSRFYETIMLVRGNLWSVCTQSLHPFKRMLMGASQCILFVQWLHKFQYYYYIIPIFQPVLIVATRRPFEALTEVNPFGSREMCTRLQWICTVKLSASVLDDLSRCCSRRYSAKNAERRGGRGPNGGTHAHTPDFHPGGRSSRLAWT